MVGALIGAFGAAPAPACDLRRPAAIDTEVSHPAANVEPAAPGVLRLLWRQAGLALDAARATRSFRHRLAAFSALSGVSPLGVSLPFPLAPDRAAGLADRAALDRAVMDDFGTHVAATGTQVVHGDIRKTLDEEITTNGLVIFVLDKGPTSDRISSGGPGYFFVTADDLEPWLGSILLNRRHHDDTRVMAHEIGHVLGIGSTQNFPSVGRHVNRENHSFEGPEAMRANGGAPVPYQWITEDRTPVAPGTPGAEVDYGHPGVCSSLMAYCSRDRGVSAPDELDFAILDDIGYDILDAATASEPELYGYGAWGRYGAWGVGVERILDDGDSLRAGAHAFGVSPATSLAESTALTGEVTWAGSLLGVDTGHAALPPVFGDAQLVVELADLAGSARFDNLAVDVNGASHAFRMPSLEYAEEVSKNAFSDEQGRVRGGFFGPAHEEMAGVLDDRDVRLLAGFGGKR